MAIESQCRNCDKFQEDNGTCYDTRIEPYYNEETCLRFREIGTPAPTVETNQEHRLPGFLSFYLWCSLGVGSFTQLLIFFYNCFAKNVDRTWQGMFDTFFSLFLAALSIYTIYAFVKRKRNAIALAKTQLIIRIVTTVIVLFNQWVLSASTTTIVRSVSSLIWSVIFLWYISTSEMVSRCIPTEKRGLTNWDIVIIAVVCAIYLIGMLAGVAVALIG